MPYDSYPTPLTRAPREGQGPSIQLLWKRPALCFWFQLLKMSHSRVPVYEGNRNNIIGVLLVKMLITLDPDNATRISTLLKDPVCFKAVSFVQETMPLFDLLNQFQTGKSKCSLQSLLRCFVYDIYWPSSIVSKGKIMDKWVKNA